MRSPRWWQRHHGRHWNNTFDPHGTYTREQSIITLLKVYSLGGVVPEQPGGEFVTQQLMIFW